MKRGELFKKIISIILIIVTILTQSELTYAAQNGVSNQKSTNFKPDQPKKDRPIGKSVKTKKPISLPYGILKNQDILEKWSGKKEDIASRTENSKTYLNEDGSKTTLMFFEPIHVKADKNASEKAKYGKNNLKESDYLEINNNLKKIDNNGSYKNNYGLYDVYFPNTNESGIRIVKDEASINLVPEGLKWDEMEVADNQAFVPTETDGITYVYSVNNTSLIEDIVLDFQTNKQTYSYDLIVSNQFDVYVDNNILYVEGKNDKRIYYTMSTPYMEDREGNVCENIKIDLQEQNGKYKLDIKLDKEWLNNTSRAYPVVIDPVIHISNDGAFRDTYVEQNRPEVTQFQRDILYIGYDDGVRSGNGENRHLSTKSFIKFQLPDELISANSIESATLNMHACSNWYSTSRIIDIKKPLSNVEIPLANSSSGTSCVSWSNMPDLGATVSSTEITGSGNYSWDLEPVITEWLNGAPNYGLALQMRNNSDPAEIFDSSQGDSKPYVEINYNSYPEPNPSSDEFKLVLERNSKYEKGTAYAKSVLKWTADVDASNEEDINQETGKYNRASIEYTLMPDNITNRIIKENFMELEWKTNKFDLEKDKAYWFKAKIKLEKWNKESSSYEEIYTDEMNTDKFVVADAQPGDTLKRLAKYYMDDASKSDDIYQLNKLEEERLFVGQKLFVMTDIEAPYSYNQPENITSTIMTQDATAGTVSDSTETVGQYINPVTGAFSYYNTDFDYSVYSNTIDFTRSYVSTLKNRKSPLGDGWDYNFNKYLAFYKDGKIGYNVGDGSRVYFTNSGGRYTTSAPTYDSLLKNGTEYEIITNDKTIYTFNNVGLLTSITDKNNNITNVSYNRNDWQTRITDALNRSIIIRYYDNGSSHTGNIKEVKLPDSSSITFDYEEGSNHLSNYSNQELNTTRYTYNDNGKLKQVIEPNNNTILTNNYTSTGKVNNQLDGENNSIHLSYDGSITTVNDANGSPYTYQFDSNKRIIQKTYPNSTYETFQYNEKGDVLKYTDTMNRLHQYTYNNLGYMTSYIRPEDQKKYQYDYHDDYLVSETIDFEGNKTSMVYDSNDNLDKVIQYNNLDGIEKQAITDYDYAANGLLQRIVDPDGIVTQIDNSNYPNKTVTTMEGISYVETFDVLGRTLSSADGNNNITRYSYDKNGNVLAVINPSDGQISRTITYTYDCNGNQISETSSRPIPDGEGMATTCYTYDKNNMLYQIIDPYNGIETYTYDGNGNVITETDQEEYKTTYEYDSINQLKSVYNPEQTQPAFTYEYDSLGNLLKMTEADGDYTAYEYDYTVGQISKELKPENYTVSYTYDDMGNLLTEKLPDSTTTYKYDGLYLPIEINKTGAATTYVQYTNAGNISEIKDDKGIEYAYHYDQANGKLKEVTEHVAGENITYNTQYTYDSNGNIKTVKDKEGNVTTYQYNEINEVSQVIDPMNKITSLSYDEDGNLSKTIDGEGNVTITQYDALNRLYKIMIPEENTTTTYLYDGRGLLDKYIDPMGNITSYNYDGVGRLKKEIKPNQQATEYLYNQDDTLSKIIYPNGETEEYAYDGLNRANWYKDRAAITYNVNYTLSGQTDYISDSVGNSVDYRYDSLGRLTEVEDTIGRITSYSYDRFSRLISETGTDGNTTSYDYDSLDRIRSITDPEQKVTNYKYNALDNITQIIKPGERTYTYDYDHSGNLTKATHPLGNSTQYLYNNNNEVSEIINARGFSKKYTYNALNVVEQVTDERNYTTKYDYYRGGLLKSVTDPLNNKTNYNYNAMSQVSCITNALNETTTMDYDFFGNVIKTSDSRGVTTTNTYDSKDNVVLTYDTQNNMTSNEYYPNGDLKKTTDQEGHITEYSYDAIHRILKTIEPNGLTKNYVYNDATGDLDKVYDNAGQQTAYTYDKMHRLLSETDAQGLVTTYTYDEFGNQTSKTTPDGNTTQYGYDELDRITSILDPENNLTEMAYDPVGNLDYIIKPTNQKYDYTYDPANNLENILDPLGQNTTYTYDANNNISTMIDPAGDKYSYQYDALNRLKIISDLSGSGSQYNYDASGNMSSFRDGNGIVTKYQYNNLNKLESVEDAEGNITRYSYYKDGNLQSMTDARGNISSYTYDAKGNMSSFTNPLGETIQYNYNLLGQIDSELKADGNTIDYKYDDYNRLESIVYPDQTSVKYTYDEFNRKISMEDANGLTEYAYDDMGRLTWVSDPNGEQISYEYDDIGRKTSVIYPDGKYVDYQYDEYDRIIGVNDREGRITRYTYDEAGRKKTTKLPNGITTTYEYDEASRITGISSIKEDGSTVLKFSYNYDGAGNRILEEIWQEDKHYKREYTYYKNNTVKSMRKTGDNAATYSYVYDSSGNISEKQVTETKDGITTSKVYQYTYDNANRLITETENGGDTRTYRYDPNGNRIARVLGSETNKDESTVSAQKPVEAGPTEISEDESTNETADYYYYDYEDHLVEIVIHNGKVFTYGYDGEGNRIWRTYSQYPVLQPPIDEGERSGDQKSKGKANAETDKNNSDNNQKNKSKDDSYFENTEPLSTPLSLYEAETTDEIVDVDNELVSLLSINENEDLIESVDSYLSNINVLSNDKDKEPNYNKNDNPNSNSNTYGNKNGENNNSNNNNGKFDNGANNGNKNDGIKDNNDIKDNNGHDSDKQNTDNDNGKDSEKNEAWKENNEKIDQDKANGKTKSHSNNGHDKNDKENGKGYANGKNKDKTNNGKHKGCYKNGKKDPYDLTNPEIFEYTGYINDINQDYTQVLMTTDVDGNYRGAYTYANGERISVEDLGQVEGTPNDPLYYLSDAQGTTAAITNMNAGIIDNNRFAPYGEPLSPVAKNSRLTNSPWGYTGESHDIEAGLVYLRARYYEPGTGRFIQQDKYPYFGNLENPLSRNLYLYGNDNPMKYTDPSGNFPFTLLIKAAANGCVDYLVQVAMNYFFNPKTQGNIGASMKKINGWQVARSAVEGLLPWKTPGGKFGRAALSGVGDVITNSLYYGKSYTPKQALLDFGAGFISDLAGGKLSEIVNKYGLKSIKKGLKLMGKSDDEIESILRKFSKKTSKSNLLDELSRSGVKYNPEDVVMVTKNSKGKLMWLENGNSKAGLTHILKGHADDFASQGIDDIPKLLNDVLNTNPINTGSNAKGLFADYVLNGNTYRVAYGTNGFIVSFYPID